MMMIITTSPNHDIVAIAVVGGGGSGGGGGAGRRADLITMYDLDREPLSRLSRHGFHNRSERSTSEFVSHIIMSVYARQLVRGQMSINVTIIFDRILLRNWRSKRDFVAIAQDA
jgi:hypothetical protein